MQSILSILKTILSSSVNSAAAGANLYFTFKEEDQESVMKAISTLKSWNLEDRQSFAMNMEEICAKNYKAVHNKLDRAKASIEDNQQELYQITKKLQANNIILPDGSPQDAKQINQESIIALQDALSNVAQSRDWEKIHNPQTNKDILNDIKNAQQLVQNLVGSADSNNPQKGWYNIYQFQKKATKTAKKQYLSQKKELQQLNEELIKSREQNKSSSDTGEKSKVSTTLSKIQNDQSVDARTQSKSDFNKVNALLKEAITNLDSLDQPIQQHARGDLTSLAPTLKDFTILGTDIVNNKSKLTKININNNTRNASHDSVASSSTASILDAEDILLTAPKPEKLSSRMKNTALRILDVACSPGAGKAAAILTAISAIVFGAFSLPVGIVMLSVTVFASTLATAAEAYKAKKSQNTEREEKMCDMVQKNIDPQKNINITRDDILDELKKMNSGTNKTLRTKLSQGLKNLSPTLTDHGTTVAMSILTANPIVISTCAVAAAIGLVNSIRVKNGQDFTIDDKNNLITAYKRALMRKLGCDEKTIEEKAELSIEKNDILRSHITEAIPEKATWSDALKATLQTNLSSNKNIMSGVPQLKIDEMHITKDDIQHHNQDHTQSITQPPKQFVRDSQNIERNQTSTSLLNTDRASTHPADYFQNRISAERLSNQQKGTSLNVK